MNYKKQIAKQLTSIFPEKNNAELFSLLEVPKNTEFGDYAIPLFTFARKEGKNPVQLAKNYAEKYNEITKEDYIATAQAVGPYLNILLNPQHVAKQILNQIYDKPESYGTNNQGEGKTIIVEFSSPNIAKPFGIGHLRSTVIGNSLYQIYKHLGYNTIAINHLGDWGTQFGKLIVAFKKWGDYTKLKTNPIQHLLDIYVQFHNEAEKNDTLNEDARQAFKQLEEGNEEYTQLWKEFKKFSLKKFDEIYKKLGVHFDSLHGESFYNDKMEDAIALVEEKIRTEISEGAKIVDLEKYKMPPVLLLKSDGATTYHTRDLAALLYRLTTYTPEKILYVVGSEQKLHFQQLFKLGELIGLPMEKVKHIDFGLFRFPEGKMSTRKGKIIFLQDVLDKAIKKITSIIAEKNPDLKNKKEVAEQVGIGAIIFGDLINDRTKNVNFDWDTMLSFEGDTGPYVQYTAARAASIIRKLENEKKIKVKRDIDVRVFSTPEEARIIKKLLQYPDILETVIQSNKPHHLSGYVIQLAQLFNQFYYKHHLLSEEEKEMRAHLLLVYAVRKVLQNGLLLLGLKSPNEM